jgi:hypothetical protein
MSKPPQHSAPQRRSLRRPAALREAKAASAGSIEVEELAIPGYDALGAREIATRLARVAFSLPALKQIEDYEAQHRNRPSVIRAVRDARSAQTHEYRSASF